MRSLLFFLLLLTVSCGTKKNLLSGSELNREKEIIIDTVVTARPATDIRILERIVLNEDLTIQPITRTVQAGNSSKVTVNVTASGELEVHVSQPADTILTVRNHTLIKPSTQPNQAVVKEGKSNRAWLYGFFFLFSLLLFLTRFKRKINELLKHFRTGKR